MYLKLRRTGGMSKLLSTAALFCFFALIALVVLITGVRSYRAVAARMDVNFSQRTALSYIANKVRQFDALGMVDVEVRDGISMLVLSEDYDGEVYETLIYCLDGHVREIFSSADIYIDPAGGMAIAPAGSVEFERTEHGINALLESDGHTETLIMTFRSGG